LKIGYKFLDHISDVYIEACGTDISEAFEQAGLAIYDTMTDLNTIEMKLEYNINVESEDLKSLLYDYLDELLFLFDSKYLLFRDIKLKIDEINGKYVLKGILKGEKFISSKHMSKIGIKAATYSLMEFIKKKDGICIKFVMDI